MKISDDYVKQMIDAQRQALKASGMDDKQIEALLAQARQAMEAQAQVMKSMGLDISQMMGNAPQQTAAAVGAIEDALEGLLDEDDIDLDAFTAANAPPKQFEKYVPIGALLIGTHGEPYGTIAVTQDREDTAYVLEEGWGIENRKEGLKMLESLMEGRHAKKFGGVFEAIKAGKTDGIDADEVECYEGGVSTLAEYINIPEAQVRGCKTLIAWDLERVGYLARLFLNMGYITDDEAWDWIGKAAAEVKKHFGAWEDYYVSVLLGRGFAMGIDEEPYHVAHDLLVDDREFLDRHPISAF
ncbi:MAG: DUF1266 domain-containing protein [Candidatus Methanoplasma sp.]|jgi:hypothetical protein|nr:DUF1266 domain-containing protein [Candidatus Methanoplasma sp.]